MQKLTFTRIAPLALRASAAFVLVVAPYQLSFVGSGKLRPAAAYANGEGGSGGGGDGHGGNSGSGGAGDHGGNSGSGGSPGSGDSSGSGGHDGGASNDDSGHEKGDHGQQHVNAAGDKIEVSDDRTEVTHPDGTREEIENGRLEVKDAAGRTIVERAATAQDVARLQSL
ncbi:hypothetical protein FJ936_15105 [Mesorhizobium sp. B2-4-13]|uniref:hypothetical protein n=1 Tax=Mesorhizobium sp. B2-4-13 TaxID=2589936 RepID=UPI001151418A|nr:hypothetical protein [Mesorhizobium sp. B2-4-13]TPK85176.1 hypothetical protein FJ936_15105 [Mesorhizobium sp. B2-4-13]